LCVAGFPACHFVELPGKDGLESPPPHRALAVVSLKCRDGCGEA
jgi:hypothetical protein